MNPNFEKYIRKTLSNQEEYVDAEALWQGVEPHVRPEKKRRRFFWWFFFGLAAGLITAGLRWTTLDFRNEVPNAAVSNPVNQESNRSILQKTESTVLNKNNSNNTLTKGENITQKEEPIVIQKLNKNTTSVISDINSKTNTSAKSISPKNIKQLINGFSNKIIESVETSSVPLEKGVTDLVPNQLPKQNKEELLVETTNYKAVKSIALATLSSEIPTKPISEDGKLITPVHKQRRWHYAIGAYGGVGKVYDELSTKTESGNSSYLAERQQTETQLESVSMGLSFMTKYKSHLSFRTGLEYHRIARRFNYDEHQRTFDTISNTVLTTYINNSTGDTFYETGTIVNSNSQSFEKEVFNYFHRLDVPLMLGYSTNGKRFRFGLEAGVHVNALLCRKGKTLLGKEELSFYDVGNDEKKWYKTTLGITPVVQASLNYRVAPRMEIHASPYYRFNTTYSSLQNNIRERYSDFGVQVGVKYWWR